ALKANGSATQARWRSEIRRLEGTSGKSAEILDGLQAIEEKSTESQLAAWQDLTRAVLSTLPDQGDALLLRALVAERRGDAASADQDAAGLVYQEARLGYYLRTEQDEVARRTLGRLEADPRLSPQRYRAIVEGAVLRGGPEALTKVLGWLSARIKREPRSAVW